MDEQELDIKNESINIGEVRDNQGNKQWWKKNLEPYQWKKGESGNPAGRPPGKSLKTFVREYLESLDDVGKAEFMKHIDPEIAWKMAEGNPKQDTDITSAGQPIPILTLNTKDVCTNNSNQENTEPDQES